MMKKAQAKKAAAAAAAFAGGPKRERVDLPFARALVGAGSAHRQAKAIRHWASIARIMVAECDAREIAEMLAHKRRHRRLRCRQRSG